MTKRTSVISDLESSLSQLEEALKLPSSLTNRDSAIKRFELTTDLAWKAVKTYLEQSKGVIVKSPKDAFREAYRQGLLAYEKKWLDLVDFRNQSVHEYDQKKAAKIYRKIPGFSRLFRSLLTSLQK